MAVNGTRTQTAPTTRLWSVSPGRLGQRTAEAPDTPAPEWPCFTDPRDPIGMSESGSWARRTPAAFVERCDFCRFRPRIECGHEPASPDAGGYRRSTPLYRNGSGKGLPVYCSGH